MLKKKILSQSIYANNFDSGKKEISVNINNSEPGLRPNLRNSCLRIRIIQISEIKIQFL